MLDAERADRDRVVGDRVELGEHARRERRAGQLGEAFDLAHVGDRHEARA